MYIDPFWFGFGVGLLSGLALLATMAYIWGRRNK